MPPIVSSQILPSDSSGAAEYSSPPAHIYRPADVSGEKSLKRVSAKKCEPSGSIGIAGFCIVISSKACFLRRLVWSVALILSLGVTIYHLTEFFRRFIDSPVVTTFSQEARREMPVPLITVCHNTKFRKSALESMLLANKSIDDWQQHREFELIDWDRFTVEDVITRASYNWSQMIYSCFVNRDVCTNIGSVKVARYSERLGLCSTFKTEEKVEESLQTGQVNLIMHEMEELGEFQNRGWTVVLHPADVPFNDLALASGVAIGVEIEPANSIEIRLTEKISSKLAISSENGVSCVDGSVQDVINCMEQCVDNVFAYTADVCRLPWKSPLEGQQSCRSFREFRLASRANSSFDSEHDTLHAALSCGCTLPCFYTTYTLSVPYSRPLIKLKRRKLIPRDSGANFGHLNLWIQSVSEVVKESRPYQWSEFTSDIGGVLGLLLGASLLSILEILDYVFCFLLNKYFSG